MDQMQEFMEYENTDESQTDLWEQKLFNQVNESEAGDNFEFLNRATDYIKKVGEVYAFKNGKDVSEVLEDADILAKGFSVIDVYYELLETEVATEYLADQPSSLVSDLGGQFGLWIGMSMITMMEILYFAIKCCRKKCF